MQIRWRHHSGSDTDARRRHDSERIDWRTKRDVVAKESRDSTRLSNYIKRDTAAKESRDSTRLSNYVPLPLSPTWDEHIGDMTRWLCAFREGRMKARQKRTAERLSSTRVDDGTLTRRSRRRAAATSPRQVRSESSTPCR